MRYQIHYFIDDSVSISEFDNLAEAIEDWTETVSYGNCFTDVELIEVRTLESGKTKSVSIYKKELG